MINLQVWWMVVLVLVLVLETVSAGRLTELAMEVLQPIPLGQEGTKCRRDSDMVNIGLLSFEMWAINMMDASSKIPPGLLTGNVLDLGNYDQCVGVEAPGFRGQHCIVQMDVRFLPNASGTIKQHVFDVAKSVGVLDPSPLLAYQFSMCVPSSCNTSDVELSVRDFLDPDDFALFEIEPTVSVNPLLCSTSEAKPIYALDYAFIGVVGALAVLLVVGTLYDFHEKEPNAVLSGGAQVLLAFSVKRNWALLLKNDESNDRLGCVDGIRVLSIIWVVWTHWYLLSAKLAQINIVDIAGWRLEWYRMPILNGTLSTDSFLLISALLLSTKFLEYCDKIGSLPNLFKMYFQRYMRLTPLYALVIFFLSTVVRFVGSGPRWNFANGMLFNNCTTSWWTNLLYVNNYIYTDNACMGETWYLAVDFQLFLLSPMLLVPIWKYKENFIPVISCLGIVLFLSTLPPLLITAIKGYPGTIIPSTDFDLLFAIGRNVYIPAHTRSAPFIVGIGLGYILYYSNSRKLHNNKIFGCFLLIVSATLMIAALFGALALFCHAPEIDPVESTAYAGFHRATWAFGLALMIFACCKGMATPINYLLSVKALQLLSKLTYSVYLIHYTLMICMGGSQRTTSYLSDYSIVNLTICTLAQSFPIAVILYVCVEAPCRQLLNIGPDKKEEKQQNELCTHKVTIIAVDNESVDGDIRL